MLFRSRDQQVVIFTLGQYLRPSRDHLPIQRYYTPAEFAEFKRAGQQEIGFRHVEAGPLVRSSYHAGEAFIGGGAKPSASNLENRLENFHG